MANTEAEYEQDLQKIRNAIYGKDVREAMADALDYVHDTSSVSGLNLKVDKSDPYSHGKFNHGANNTVTGASDSHPAAFGNGNTVSGVHAFAVGFGNNATNDESVAEGVGTTASGAHSHAAGYYTVASGSDQFVVGKYNAVDENAMLIVGNGSDQSHKANVFVVKKNGAMSVGTSSSANGQGSAAIGANITTYEDVVGQVVVGKNNVVVQDAIFVVANGSQPSTKNNALVIKQDSSIDASGHRFTFGTGLFPSSSSGVHQFVTGKYNKYSRHDYADSLFVVGNGSSNDSRSNALEVCSDGSLILGSTIIKNGDNQYDLSLLSSVSQKVDKQLSTPISISGSSYTTVDATLRALAAHASIVGDVVITTAIVYGTNELSPTMGSSSYALISNVFSAGKTIILYVQYGASLSNSKIHVARLIERTGDMFETFIFECYSKDLSKRIRYSVNTVNETITGTIIS